MGLPRRQFTKEFKLAAVRRLETGASLAEVTRGLEVNPTCCNAGGANSRRRPQRVSLERAATLVGGAVKA